MTSETAPAEAATTRPTAGEPSVGGAVGLTRSQWRRLAAEAELAAKVAAVPATDLATSDDADHDLAVEDGELTNEIDGRVDETPEPEAPSPVATADADASADAELVLTVVDGDSHAGAEFVAPTRRRRRGPRPAATTSSAPGESFGPAAVDGVTRRG
ncbi:MAG: hypothetical protein PGN24_03650, partial [Microbacterium arborescens]